MLLIDQLIPSVSREELLGKEEDQLVLTWEQRRWGRCRLTSARGRDVALALPTGATLAPGAVLRVEPQWYLVIEAAAEPLLAIFPPDYGSAVRTAFEVGNRHFPLAMNQNTLWVPDDPAMVQLLERLQVPWERQQAVFNPIGSSHRHEH